MGTAACGGAGPDRDAYVRANEAVFDQLPLIPGARLRDEVSTPVHAEEEGPVVGYTTRFDLDLPHAAAAAPVASFFRRGLEPKWRMVERLRGPVLNFRRGRASVSINLESWRAHVLEVAVDHRH